MTVAQYIEKNKIEPLQWVDFVRNYTVTKPVSEDKETVTEAFLNHTKAWSKLQFSDGSVLVSGVKMSEPYITGFLITAQHWIENPKTVVLMP